MKYYKSFLLLIVFVLICSSCKKESRLIMDKEYKILGHKGSGLIFKNDLVFRNEMGFKYSIKDGIVLIETFFGIRTCEIIDKGVLKYDGDFFAVFEESDFSNSSEYIKKLAGKWTSLDNHPETLIINEDSSCIYSYYSSYDFKYNNIENLKVTASKNIIRLIWVNSFRDEPFQEYYYKIINGNLYLNNDMEYIKR